MGARFEIVVTDSSQGKPRDDRTPRDDSPRDDQRPAQQVAGQSPAQPPAPQASAPPAAQQAPVSSSRSAPSDRQPAPSSQRASQESSEPDDAGKQWEKVAGQLVSYAETVASTIAGGPVVSQLAAMIGVARPLIGAFRGDRTKQPVSDSTNVARNKTSPIPPSSQRGNREDGTLPLAADRSSRALDQLAVSAGRASRSIDDPRQPIEQPPTDRQEMPPVEQPPLPPSNRQPSQRPPIEQPPDSRQNETRPPVDVSSDSLGEQPPVEGEVNDETLSVIRHLMGRDEDLPSGVSQDTVDAIERLLDSGVDFSPPRSDAPVNAQKPSAGPVAPIGDPMAPVESLESAQPPSNVRPPHLDALEAAQRLPRPASGGVPSTDPMAPVLPKPPPGASPATPALGAPPVAALPKPILPAPVGAAGAVVADTGLGVAGGAGVAVGAAGAAGAGVAGSIGAAIGSVTSAIAAIPVAIAAPVAAVAGSLVLLARSGKQAHDVMGPLGVVVTGAVTAINPVAGMLVGPVLKQIQAFGDAVERQVNELAEYSGVLSIAQARTELREMRTEMSAARRLAPELSKFENTRSRLGESINANITEFRLLTLRLLEPLLPMFDRSADFIDAVTEVMKKYQDFIEGGASAAAEQALRLVLGDSIVNVLKLLQIISSAVESEEEKDITNDPFIDELLSNLGAPGGPTGAIGGGGVPRRRP